jgi:hypothetical protein
VVTKYYKQYCVICKILNYKLCSLKQRKFIKFCNFNKLYFKKRFLCVMWRIMKMPEYSARICIKILHYKNVCCKKGWGRWGVFKQVLEVLPNASVERRKTAKTLYNYILHWPKKYTCTVKRKYFRYHSIFNLRYKNHT